MEQITIFLVWRDLIYKKFFKTIWKRRKIISNKKIEDTQILML